MCPDDGSMSIDDFMESPIPPLMEFKISDADRKKASQMFDAAGKAVERQNYDYAVNMLLQAVRLVPDELRYRQTLRGCARRQFAGGKRPRGAGIGFQAKVKVPQLRKNWREVMEVCEETLAKHPWDAPAHLALANALFNTGRLDDAIWILQSLANDDRENIDLLRQLGEYLELRGDLNDAIGCFQRIVHLKPNDEDAELKVKDLSAYEAIERSKLEEAESFRETLRDQAKSQRLEESGRNVQSEDRVRERIQELEIDLDVEPENINLYFDLAAQHNRLGESREAEAALKKAYEVSGGRFDVHMRLADLQMQRLAEAAAHAQRAAQKNPDDEQLKKQLAAARKERLVFEMDEYAQRVKNLPSELQWRYEFGVRLMQAGRHQEAIGQLQRARSDPARRVHALQYLGRCFFYVGNMDLAVSHLQEAIDALGAGNDELRIKLHYELMRVAEKAGREDLYREHLNAAAAMDYGYRDVAKRLGKQQNGPAAGDPSL